MCNFLATTSVWWQHFRPPVVYILLLYLSRGDPITVCAINLLSFLFSVGSSTNQYSKHCSNRVFKSISLRFMPRGKHCLRFTVSFRLITLLLRHIRWQIQGNLTAVLIILWTGT